MPDRSYRQHCALARALDVVGDRWSLLILRNLVLGPQSWSELLRGMPGVARNLLSSRLKHLGAAGVVDHDGARYRLSPKGREIEGALFALADWGERHCMGPPAEGDAMRLRYFMTSLRRKLRPGPRPVALQLFVDGAAFWVRLGAEPTVEQGERPADETWRTTPGELMAWVFAGQGGERAPPGAHALRTALGEAATPFS